MGRCTLVVTMDTCNAAFGGKLFAENLSSGNPTFDGTVYISFFNPMKTWLWRASDD
ncbi:hypothetical protein O9992_23550 [Vibrio lentus]|nr:hypothetical protein [Vibrio lentus]